MQVPCEECLVKTSCITGKDGDYVIWEPCEDLLDLLTFDMAIGARGPYNIPVEFLDSKSITIMAIPDKPL